MRFLIQVVDKSRKKIGIPSFIQADSIDAAIEQFITQDAGHYLPLGHMLEVMGEDQKKHNYLYSKDGKPTWTPTF